MSTTTIAGQEVHVDDEGFLTEYDEWNEDLGRELAAAIGIDSMTDEHWEAIRFLRSDYVDQEETATLRRVFGMVRNILFRLEYAQTQQRY